VSGLIVALILGLIADVNPLRAVTDALWGDDAPKTSPSTFPDSASGPPQHPTPKQSTPAPATGEPCRPPGAKRSTPVAPASDSYEPNNEIAKAFGPLRPTHPGAYEALIGTENDEDFYLLCLSDEVELDIGVSLIGCTGPAACANLFACLLDTDGNEIDSASLYARGETAHLRQTLPEGRYYLQLFGDESNRYRFMARPAQALTAHLTGPVSSVRDSGPCQPIA
jgi:hypothetical protein